MGCSLFYWVNITNRGEGNMGWQKTRKRRKDQPCPGSFLLIQSDSPVDLYQCMLVKVSLYGLFIAVGYRNIGIAEDHAQTVYHRHFAHVYDIGAMGA